MGAENAESDSRMYLMTKDDTTWEKIVEIKHFPEITDIQDTQVETFSIPDSMIFSVSLGKHYRCTSRKRLVKLIMGMGFDKRTAEDVAHSWNVCGCSYQVAWMHISFWTF